MNKTAIIIFGLLILIGITSLLFMGGVLAISLVSVQESRPVYSITDTGAVLQTGDSELINVKCDLEKQTLQECYQLGLTRISEGEAWNMMKASSTE